MIEDDGSKREVTGTSEDPEAVQAEAAAAELTPEPPAYFITLRWDSCGTVELDIGDVSYFEARGLLHAALQEITEFQPGIIVRSTKGAFDQEPFPLDDDDEDDETEEP